MAAHTARIGIALRAAAFLLLATFVFYSAIEVCESSAWDIGKVGSEPWVEYSSALRIHNLKPNTLDVIAFGGSTCATSFSPMDIWLVSGIASHNYGGSWQSPYQSYFLLKEVLKEQNPQVVFLESYQLVGYQPDEKTYRACFDPLPLSENKLQAISEHLSAFPKEKQTDQTLSYLFSINKYRQTWKTLTEFGFTKVSPLEDYYGFYGFVYRHRVTPQSEEVSNFVGFTDTGTGRANYQPEALLYAKKMIDLCKQNGITLILYKTPHIGWSAEAHNSVQSFADQNGVKYIDFNMGDYCAQAGISFATMFDDNAHMNIIGGIAMSQYLGRYLRDNLADLPDHTGEPSYAAYENDLTRYKREVFNECFIRETNMSLYLDLLTAQEVRDYTIIFSVKDDCQAQMGEEILGKMRAMGFNSDKVFEEYGHSFIGVWQDERVIYEARSEDIDNAEVDTIDYKGVLPDGMKYYVKSAGYRCGNISNIVIDGTEKSKNSRGFNVVVYDSRTGRVVDSICWDTHANAGTTFKR
ncbi:MAG: hypothetical protein LBL96_08325 [Clostridiales bacterium]|jgi:hypothetical protein|nr:hypothetical protein [Clostridiales bacterium]